VFHASLADLRLGLALAGGRVLSRVDGHDKILLGHQIIFCDEMRKSVAQIRFGLELVEDATMMKVGVRKYAVHTPAHGTELGH